MYNKDLNKIDQYSSYKQNKAEDYYTKLQAVIQTVLGKQIKHNRRYTTQIKGSIGLCNKVVVYFVATTY